ncbi:outer membrane protein [Methylobacterium sp. WSM2598]|uniref:outer membrane protein n=1 Tax=Methylobacterium sp. WSM2598 TaxID=398261 RepID=UPI000369D7AA|nr:outer membrane beta-barrel protein [Methylobacterium sp. WSM2598]
MGRSKPRALARIVTLAAGIGVPGFVHAADLLPPPPPPPPPVEVGGGWYLRGDVGVGITDLRQTIAEDVTVPAKPYKYKTIQDHLSDQFFIGAGVGYQFNPWLRADISGEYRSQADWRFVSKDVSPGVGPGQNLYNRDTGKLSTVVSLANVYADLGTWYGVTPFIGAGVGVAHHMFGSVTDEGLGDAAGGFGYGPSNAKTNLAWAVHAGLGYAVSPNLKLELAYRYLNMGEARSGRLDCFPGCVNPPLSTVYTLKDIESHDIKIGMRWMLGGPVVAPVPVPVASFEPAPPPGPIVRKY